MNTKPDGSGAKSAPFSRTPLDAGEIGRALETLPGWSLAAGGARDGGNALAKTCVFRGFREALTFMVRVGFEAEALDHHPEWTNVYNRVVIRLNTHDAGGRVTAKDVELARRIEKIANREGGIATGET